MSKVALEADRAANRMTDREWLDVYSNWRTCDESRNFRSAEAASKLHLVDFETCNYEIIEVTLRS